MLIFAAIGANARFHLILNNLIVKLTQRDPGTPGADCIR